MNRWFARHRRFTLTLACFALMALVVTACTPPPAGQGTEEADKTLRIGYGSNVDPADIADLLGLQILEDEMGYEVEIIELTEDSNVVAGMISDSIDVGSIGLPDSIKASALGVPLRLIMPTNMVGEFVLIGQPGIATVEDMIGKKVAYHGPGSGTEILPRLLVRQAGIDENDIEWIILPESPNRAAAMEAERIDVTALEFADVLTLREGGRDYEIIASFSDVAPGAIYGTWATTQEYADQNPEVIRDLAIALARGYKQAREDKDAWMTVAQERLTEISEDRLSQTYDFYIDIGMFPAPPFYDQATWDTMNEFYTSVGEYDDPAPFDMVLTDALEAAVSALEE